MRVEELTAALRTAAEQQPPVRSTLAEVLARGGRRRRRRAWAVSALGVGVVVALVGSITTWRNGTDDHQVLTDGVSGVTGRWEELPAPPLSPRARVVGVWTGSEVLLVGGDTWLCPPNASCVAPDEPPLSDGAALDPDTGSWRAIAPSPLPFSYASTAVLGDDVYFLVESGDGVAGARPVLLKYSLPDDRWEELPGPPRAGLGSLVAAGEVLVAFAGSDEQGEVPDQFYD